MVARTGGAARRGASTRAVDLNHGSFGPSSRRDLGRSKPWRARWRDQRLDKRRHGQTRRPGLYCRIRLAMKSLISAALLALSLLGISGVISASEKTDAEASLTLDMANPELLRLERTLTAKQSDKKEERLTFEQYQKWEIGFRETLAAAVARIPSSPDNSAAHARIMALLGDRDQAQAALGQALELNPESALLVRTRGQILYEQNDFPEAARLGLQAWEQSGRTDFTALALYQKSKGRSAPVDAVSPTNAGSVKPQDGIAAPSQTAVTVPLDHIVKNVWTNLPSPPAPVDVDPMSKDASASDIARTVFFAAATATGGLFLFLGFGAKPLEEKFPNIRRNTGIALGVTGALAIAAVSWPVTHAAIVAQGPPILDAGKRLKDRLSGSFAQVAGSEAGAIMPAGDRALQAAPTLNNLNIHLAAKEIAGGHAYLKHAADMGIKNPVEFAARIESIMANPTMMRTLSNGRTAYWHQASATVVIRDPSALDGGTAFVARNGLNYFLNLR